MVKANGGEEEIQYGSCIGIQMSVDGPLNGEEECSDDRMQVDGIVLF